MLALVGGEGRLPMVLIEALNVAGQPFRLCEVEGFPVAARGDRPVMRFRLETLGSFISDLVDYGTSRICFAGRIDRPAIDISRVDAKTQPLLPMIAQALQVGDDAALRIVLKFFEQAGIEVVSPVDIVPDLMPPEGVLTKAQPDDEDRRDAERGAQIIAAMAQVDVGQACVVSKGQALAIEALPGTDWMLRSLAPPAIAGTPTEETLDWIIQRISEARGRRVSGSRPHELAPGGVLVKCAKPGQDRRVDLPTVGLDTIGAVHRARLRGIVIEAGSVLVPDRAATVEEADRLGLFIWVRS